MAAGTHWEWRGFGPPSLEPLVKTLGALPKLFGPTDTGAQETDEYLWTPNLAVNVKFRKNQLKFKRRLRSTAGCELWTERSDETFSFPLNDAAITFVGRTMSVKPPPGDCWSTIERFRAALPAFVPAVS